MYSHLNFIFRFLFCMISSARLPALPSENCHGRQKRPISPIIAKHPCSRLLQNLNNFRDICIFNSTFKREDLKTLYLVRFYPLCDFSEMFRDGKSFLLSDSNSSPSSRWAFFATCQCSSVSYTALLFWEWSVEFFFFWKGGEVLETCPYIDTQCVPKKLTNRMLLEPRCTGQITHRQHPLCLGKCFLVVSD